MDFSIETLKQETAAVMEELFRNCSEGHYTLRKGDILVIACSTSKVMGFHMGTHSTEDAARAIMETVLPYVHGKGLFLACQCCEHLNRALVVERAAAEKYMLDEVCVRPMPKAGGSFATAVYDRMSDPVMVEHVKAHAGMDIGCTLIGMHLKDVAVPLRLSVKKIGDALVTAAYTRPKLIGGVRAHYPE